MSPKSPTEDALKKAQQEAELQEQEEAARKATEAAKQRQTRLNELALQRRESDEKASAQYKSNNSRGNREADLASAERAVRGEISRAWSPQQTEANNRSAETWGQELDSKKYSQQLDEMWSPSQSPKTPEKDTLDIDWLSNEVPQSPKSPGSRSSSVDFLTPLEQNPIDELYQELQSKQTPKSQKSFEQELEERLSHTNDAKETKATSVDALEQEAREAGIITPKSPKLRSLGLATLKRALSLGQQAKSSPKQESTPKSPEKKKARFQLFGKKQSASREL